MKYFFTGIFLLVASFASAQIVNFPDPNFKNYLLTYYPYIDANGDGQVQVSEANYSAVNLVINQPGNTLITDLTGIKEFKYLIGLYLQGTQVTTVDLSGGGFLQFGGLEFHDNFLLTDVNLSGVTTINVINIQHSNLLHMDVTGLPALTTVYLDNNPNLLDFTAEAAPKLKQVSLDGCGTTASTFNLKNCDSLQLVFAYLNAQTFDVSGCGKLASLAFGNAVIGSLIAKNCVSLQAIYIYTGGSVNDFLDVTGCTSLDSIHLGNSNLQTLDLSTCTNLQQLTLLGAGAGPTSINIKNGISTNVLISGLNTSANNLNICTDAFETNMVAQQLSGYPSALNVNSFCSFLPGGTYNTIKGKTSIDLNNNGCDVADGGIAYMPVKIVDNTGNYVVKYTNTGGNYVDYPYAGNFTISPYFPYPYFTISPTTANINFSTANSLVDSVNYCIQPNGTYNDLEINLLPVWPPARPGFEAAYQLVFKNRGTSTQSGNVQLNYDNSKMSFSYASITVNTQSPGQLTWNYTNIAPFESRTIDVRFVLFAPPINNIGDTIFYLALVNPVANDYTAFNNSFILPQKCIASWDPNDKQCLEGSSIDIAAIGKPLDYIIHFQNLGTDTAFNIVVADALSDKFDWNSIEITGSSHPCDIQQRDGKLEFFFQNINLPYSAINEPASHGFVAFKIKPNSNLVIGDSLNNKASIYFDFNLPVITNTATTVVSPTSSVPVKLEYFSLTSKNETNLLTWKAPSTTGITNFGIERSNDGIHFNNLGNITASVDRCQLPFNFTDEKPFNGKTYYRLNIKNADGHSFYSKVLVAGRTRSGLSVNAIVSNQNNTTLYLNASKEQNVQMKIIAADGKLLYYQSKTIATGNSILNLPLKNLATGIYTLIVYTSEGEVITKRFMK